MGSKDDDSIMDGISVLSDIYTQRIFLVETVLISLPVTLYIIKTKTLKDM